MGARCTFVFKQSEDLAVALYSHWGEDSLYTDLAAALEHAAPRLSDESYYIRMAVSYLMKDDILEQLHVSQWIQRRSAVDSLIRLICSNLPR